jgi:hypothetical protein
MRELITSRAATVHLVLPSGVLMLQFVLYMFGYAIDIVRYFDFGCIQMVTDGVTVFVTEQCADNLRTGEGGVGWS